MNATRSDAMMPGAERTTTDAVTLDSIVRYAGASGDFTSFHWDLVAARDAGYDRLFAMGMLGAGKLSALVVDWFGARNIDRFKVRFRERAWVGSEVTYRARVAEVNGDVARLQLVADTDGGDTVLIDGEAVVRLK